MRYPVQIEEVDGSYVATINHPNGLFQGATEGATFAEASDAARVLLGAMIAEAMTAGDPVPSPSECEPGNAWIAISPMIAAKAGIHNEMLLSKKRKADIARSMGVDQKQVDRILNPNHRSTLEQLEGAAKALGKHLELKIA